MYREILERLSVNETISVFANVQVWRNNASRLRKETGKIFHIKNLDGYTLIIRLV